jgi:hypothetical protein
MASEAQLNDPIPPEDQQPTADGLSFDQPGQDAADISSGQPRIEMTFDLPPGMQVQVTS